MVTAGPVAAVAPATLTVVQGAILAGCCVEFGYATDERPELRWRRVIPYGLVHGPLTYLIGKIPGRDDQPVYYRLDHMADAQLSETLGCAPDDWDIDAWLTESFGVWRDEKRGVALRILPDGAAHALGWRFHRSQQVEQLDDGGLRVRFATGGMRELAEHLFTWGGQLVIEAPDALIDMMRERVAAAIAMLPDEESSTTGTDAAMAESRP